MKANFQFAIYGMSPMKWRRRKASDDNTRSQITSENVNQYWLIFDCFQIIPFVDQLKIEYFQQSKGGKESFILRIFLCVVLFEKWKTESWKGWLSLEKCFSDVSFMCFGDIQQMIDVESRGTRPVIVRWRYQARLTEKEILPQIFFRLSGGMGLGDMRI